MKDASFLHRKCSGGQVHEARGEGRERERERDSDGKERSRRSGERSALTQTVVRVKVFDSTQHDPHPSPHASLSLAAGDVCCRWKQATDVGPTCEPVNRRPTLASSEDTR